MTRALRLAVVGHTNTGKTSLMRTLLREESFGEVDDRPGVTQTVTGVRLAGDEGDIELLDTPGLEDSVRLLARLDGDHRPEDTDRVAAVERFLESPPLDFTQEAAALGAVRGADAALYVIDARDRVLARTRDELEILARCGRPIVPVLNWVATPETHVETWRDALRRLNLHAIAEFDTVVFDATGERRLYEKLGTLLDEAAPVFDGIIARRARERAALIDESSNLIAAMIIAIAAAAERVPVGEPDTATLEAFRDRIRSREQRCVRDLLDLHGFTSADVASDELPLADGAWGVDLFSPAALRTFGVSAGGGAAAGAMAGLTLDVLLGGLSLGTGTLAGAAIGGLIGSVRSHGRRLVDRARGTTMLRVGESTLALLVARESLLLRALLRRGHAAVDEVDLPVPDARPLTSGMRRELGRAREHPSWTEPGADPARDAAKRRLATALRATWRTSS